MRSPIACLFHRCIHAKQPETFVFNPFHRIMSEGCNLILLLVQDNRSVRLADGDMDSIGTLHNHGSCSDCNDCLPGEPVLTSLRMPERLHCRGIWWYSTWNKRSQIYSSSIGSRNKCMGERCTFLNSGVDQTKSLLRWLIITNTTISMVAIIRMNVHQLLEIWLPGKSLGNKSKNFCLNS